MVRRIKGAIQIKWIQRPSGCSGASACPAHCLKVSRLQSAPPTYQLCMWSTAGDVDRRVDLLDELKPLIAGLCRLMKAVHLATGFNSNYTQQSVLFVTGNDDDGVGF